MESIVGCGSGRLPGGAVQKGTLKAKGERKARAGTRSNPIRLEHLGPGRPTNLYGERWRWGGGKEGAYVGQVGELEL